MLGARRARAILWPIAALAWCVALGAAIGQSRIVSTSGDLALHYQLVEYFHGGLWRLPSPHSYLQTMGEEPNLAHRLAAVAWLAGFPELSALSVTGVAAAAVVWLGLFDQARRVSTAVLLAGLALTLANLLSLRALFGAEIIGNFFLPQMVGEAVCVAAAAAGAWLLPRSRAAFVVFAVAATLVCGVTHSLPAAQLGGAFVLLLAIEGAHDASRGRRPSATILAGLALVPASVVLNPYFAVSIMLSHDDGSIGFRGRVTLAGLATAEVALVVLAAAMLLAYVRQPAATQADRAAQLLSALGLSIAGLGLAQMLLWGLGRLGSPYAALKHAFAVFSLLGLMIPVAIWAALGRRALAWDVSLRRAGPWLAVVAQLLIVAPLFLKSSHIDLARADRLLDEARALRVMRGFQPGPGGPLLIVAGAPPVLSYAGTLGALHTSEDDNTVALSRTGDPFAPQAAAALVVTAGDRSYDLPQCRRGPPFGDLVVVDGACAAAARLALDGASRAPPAAGVLAGAR